MRLAVDASALVAILLDEAESVAFSRLLLAASEAVVSPINYWEAAVRLGGLHGETGLRDLDTLIAKFDITTAPVTARTAQLAIQAQTRYGKRTPAKLNLGDCFAYALAKELDAPLLFKGGDFSKTDIRPALTG